MLSEIQKQIETKHQQALESKTDLRSLELWWKQIVERRYDGAFVPPFAGRDRQNLRDILTKYSVDRVKRMMRHAVDSWPVMREQPYLNLLPPTPTFRAFYIFRENIFSHLEAQERKEKKQQVLTTEAKEEVEKKKGSKVISLREMVKQALKEQRMNGRK